MGINYKELLYKGIVVSVTRSIPIQQLLNKKNHTFGVIKNSPSRT